MFAGGAGYTAVVHASPTPTLRSWGAPVAAAAAVAALWAGREVVAIDVLARLLLPAVWLLLWSLACIGLGGAPARRLMGGDRSSATDLVVVLATGAGILSLIAIVVGLTTLTAFIYNYGFARFSKFERLISLGIAVIMLAFSLSRKGFGIPVTQSLFMFICGIVIFVFLTRMQIRRKRR